MDRVIRFEGGFIVRECVFCLLAVCFASSLCFAGSMDNRYEEWKEQKEKAEREKLKRCMVPYGYGNRAYSDAERISVYLELHPEMKEYCIELIYGNKSSISRNRSQERDNDIRDKGSVIYTDPKTGRTYVGDENGFFGNDGTRYNKSGAGVVDTKTGRHIHMHIHE